MTAFQPKRSTGPSAKSIQTKDNHSERERETNGPHISQ